MQSKQDAQLSQRYRAARCVIVFAKSRRLELGDNIYGHYTLCSKKSDAKIQITITTAYLTRIKYPPSGFNYHLSGVNVANFN